MRKELENCGTNYLENISLRRVHKKVNKPKMYINKIKKLFMEINENNH